MDLATIRIQTQSKEKYEEHIEWLKPQDPLNKGDQRIRVCDRLHDARETTANIANFM